MKKYLITKGDKQYEYWMRDKGATHDGNCSFVMRYLRGKYISKDLIKAEDEDKIRKMLEAKVKENDENIRIQAR